MKSSSSIQGLSLLLLLVTYSLLILSLSLPSYISSSPTLAQLTRLHPSLAFVIPLGLKALDGAVCVGFALFLVGTVWERMPQGTRAPRWMVVPAYALSRGPMMELLHLAQSVEMSLLLAGVLLLLLVIVQSAIRTVAWIIQKVHSVGKGAVQITQAVMEALGQGNKPTP